MAVVILQAEKLRRSFGSLEVLKDLSFCLHAGELLRLKGDNGCGKSTLLQLLRGHLRLDEGTITLGDQEIHGWSALRRAKSGLRSGYQNPSLPQDLTVSSFLNQFGIQDLGELQPLADIDVCNLSFGEKKALDNLRALHPRSSVILLDEPSAGLAFEFLGLLQSRVALALKRGAGVLWVAHHLEPLGSLPHRTLILQGGTLQDVDA